MKIYLVSHGLYEENEVTLCTIDFELAIKHLIDYSKSGREIEVWENDKLIFDYGSLNYHIVNSRKEITYDELKEDFLKYFHKEQ